MQVGFLHALAARADCGADLCFRTDDGPYFAAAKAVVAQHPDWQLSAGHWPFERATVFQSRATHYQSLVAVRRVNSAKL